MGKVVLLLLVVAVAFLYFTNPKQPQHSAALATAMVADTALARCSRDSLLGSLRYVDFFVGSALQRTDNKTMVTYGWASGVRVLGDALRPRTSPLTSEE